MSVNELASDPTRRSVSQARVSVQGTFVCPPLCPFHAGHLSLSPSVCLSLCVFVCARARVHTYAHEGTGVWLCGVCTGQQMTVDAGIQGLSPHSL